MAFRAIFETHAPLVRRMLRCLHVRRADRDDLSQEVFAVVYRKLGDYDGRVPLRHFIHSICFRVVSTYRRSAPVRREVLGAEFPEPEFDVAALQEEEWDTRRTRDLLMVLSDDLDPEKKVVFVLHDLEGIIMNKVAEAVGCPLQTAYSRLHVARETIKVLIRKGPTRLPIPRRADGNVTKLAPSMSGPPVATCSDRPCRAPAHT